MLEDDDATLTRAAQAGDTAAFALLLVRHRPMAAALCLQKLGDLTLAEDAVQEAALRALLNLRHLRQPDRFGSWLAGIALNICRVWVRSRSRECWSWETLDKMPDAVGPLGRAEQNRLLTLVSDDRPDRRDPEVTWAAADLAASVRAAVAALPEGQQRAVRLFYLSDLSYKETATLLGIAEGAVRTRLFKARGTLRGMLRILAEEEHLVMTEQTAAETTTRVIHPEDVACSFCAKDRKDVHRLIAGPGGVYICSECIALCNQIMAEEEAKTAAAKATAE